MNPIKKNKGSAIFIHVAKNNFKKTEGCVTIKKGINKTHSRNKSKYKS